MTAAAGGGAGVGPEGTEPDDPLAAEDSREDGASREAASPSLRAIGWTGMPPTRTRDRKAEGSRAQAASRDLGHVELRGQRESRKGATTSCPVPEGTLPFQFTLGICPAPVLLEDPVF